MYPFIEDKEQLIKELHVFAEFSEVTECPFGIKRKATVIDVQIGIANLSAKASNVFYQKMVFSFNFLQPSIFFRECLKNGELQKFFPELVACVGCLQDERYHKDDVFDHTMKALDHAATVDRRNLIFMLSVLFHDIGKPVVKKVIGG